MWRCSRTECALWPVSPRPFADEPLGGWLGRVAARYRVSVDQLWADSGLDRRPITHGTAWLLWSDVGLDNLCRLATLARVDVGRLAAIEPPSAWVRDPDRLPYCFACLMLNPMDVSAPRWKHEWLAPGTEWCRLHMQPLQSISALPVRRAQHFGQLLAAVRRHHYAKRRSARL